MVTWSRNIETPKEFELQPAGRAVLQDKLYTGFVKDTSDALYMGQIGRAHV